MQKNSEESAKALARFLRESLSTLQRKPGERAKPGQETMNRYLNRGKKP